MRHPQTQKDPTPALVFEQLKKLVTTFLHGHLRLLHIVEADLVALRQRIEALEQHDTLTPGRKKK